nr:AzlC family ABC transporter permease [Biomaibacter acetigenes]
MKSLYVSKYRQAIAGKKQGSIEFCHGLRQGIPIALGYIPVSFTFGLMAVNGGIPVWTAILISLSNLTSAGQFAGTNLIIANASLLEITLTTFVVNIRYMLMSLSLSQKVAPQMAFLKRCIVAFGITDETFAIASLEKGEITFNYFLGLVTCPYWGWALGTALGALTSSVLPKTFQSSMGIALYAMFIALVVPAAKKIKSRSCRCYYCYLYKFFISLGPISRPHIGGMEHYFCNYHCVRCRCSPLSQGGG